MCYQWKKKRRKEKKEKERKENESLNFLSGWSVSISGQIKERLRQYKSSYFYNEIQYSLCIRRFMQHIFFIFANFILCPNVLWSKLMVIFLGSKCTLDSILWIKYNCVVAWRLTYNRCIIWIIDFSWRSSTLSYLGLKYVFCFLGIYTLLHNF